VRTVSGTALFLDRDHWSELSLGDVLVEPFTIRTLRPGRLSLASTDAALAIGPNSAASVASTNTMVRVELLAGTATAFVQAEMRGMLVAGGTQVELAYGQADLLITADGPEIRARKGLVSVPDATGGPARALAPGDSLKPAGLDRHDPDRSDDQQGSATDEELPPGDAGSGGRGSGNNSPSNGGGDAAASAGGGDAAPSSGSGGGNGRGGA
jgi:hypothetical protein